MDTPHDPDIGPDHVTDALATIRSLALRKIALATNDVGQEVMDALSFGILSHYELQEVIKAMLDLADALAMVRVQYLEPIPGEVIWTTDEIVKHRLETATKFLAADNTATPLTKEKAEEAVMALMKQSDFANQITETVHEILDGLDKNEIQLPVWPKEDG
jgi:hypothetical protein